MPTTQLQIHLTPEMAEFVHSKVAHGDYASENDVILDGLRRLADRDVALENWLQNEVAPAFDALRANPGRAIPAEQVRGNLAGRHREIMSRG